MTVGEKIKTKREQKGLTQKQLGVLCGFTDSTADSRIRKYEKDIMAPKNAIRQKIANALDTDIDYFFDTSFIDSPKQVSFLLDEMNNKGMNIGQLTAMQPEEKTKVEDPEEVEEKELMNKLKKLSEKDKLYIKGIIDGFLIQKELNDNARQEEIKCR